MQNKLPTAVVISTDINDYTFNHYNSESKIINLFLYSSVYESNCNKKLHVGEWRDKWLDYLAQCAGHDNISGREYVKTTKDFITFRFQYIEKSFPDADFQNNVDLQTCLRALLTEVPNYIRAFESRVGVVIFIAKETFLLGKIISQNLGQFESMYTEYKIDKNYIKLPNFTIILRKVKKLLPKDLYCVRFCLKRINGFEQYETEIDFFDDCGNKIGIDYQFNEREIEKYNGEVCLFDYICNSFENSSNSKKIKLNNEYFYKINND